MSILQSSPATEPQGKRYYGKYRGLVIENVDPMLMGRVLAQVPDVLGEIPSSWCMPCVPAAGIQSGMFIVPPPVLPPVIGQNICIQTPGQNTVLISDSVPTPITGGIVLKSTSGAMIVCNDTGIYLSAGPGLASIWLVGPAIMMNETALTIVGP